MSKRTRVDINKTGLAPAPQSAATGGSAANERAVDQAVERDMSMGAAHADESYVRGKPATSYSMKTGGSIYPFWHEEPGDSPSSKVDKLVVGFEFKGLRISNQQQTTYSIRGDPTLCNNPLKHLPAGSAFEDVLENAPGHNVAQMIRQLQRIQRDRPLSCPSTGLDVEIRQPDQLDSYIAYMPAEWFSEAAQKLRTLLEKAPPLVARHPVFAELSRLVSMEKREYYDAYVYMLIVLFNWLEYEDLTHQELEHRYSRTEDLVRLSNDAVALRAEIDLFINDCWLYQDIEGVALRDVRHMCLLHGSMFVERTTRGIEDAIKSQLVDVATRRDRSGIIPDRHEVSRITIKYGPEALYDDWTVNELITSLFRSLFEKKIRFKELLSNIRGKIQEEFFNSTPAPNKSVEMKLLVAVDILFDDEVLSLFGLSGRGVLRPEQMSVASGEFELKLEFKNCASGSQLKPRLLYTLRAGSPRKHIHDSVGPATSFDLNLAYELLLKIYPNKADEIYKTLRNQLSTVTDDASLYRFSSENSPMSSPIHGIPERLPTLTAQIDEYERQIDTYIMKAQQAEEEYGQVIIRSNQERSAIQAAIDSAGAPERERLNELTRIYEAKRKGLGENASREQLIEFDDLTRLRDEARAAYDAVKSGVAETQRVRLGELASLRNKAEATNLAAKERMERAISARKYITSDVRTLALQQQEEIADREAEIETERADYREKKARRKRDIEQARSSGLLRGAAFLAKDSSDSDSDSDFQPISRPPLPDYPLPDNFLKAFPTEQALSASGPDGVRLELQDMVVTFSGFDKPGGQTTLEVVRDGERWSGAGKTAAEFLTQSFDILSRELNVLKVHQNLRNPRFQENGNTITGLYPHQIKIIESIAQALSVNRDSTIVVEASVGAGKTTVVLGVVKAVEKFAIHNHGDPTRRPFVIYMSDDTSLLRDIYGRAGSVGLSVIAAAHTAPSFMGTDIGIMFRRWVKGSDANTRIDSKDVHNALDSCTLVVCHLRTGLYLLQMLENGENQKAVKRPYSIIVDEVKTEGGINGESEHALAAILAFKPQREWKIGSGRSVSSFFRAKNIAIFSASVKSDGPIRYLTSRSHGVKFIRDSTTLVPTELRQLGRNPPLLDVFMGYTDPAIIKKVRENSFFRRFISNAANQQLQQLINQPMDTALERQEMESLKAETQAFYDRMYEHLVTEQSVLYNMYPAHRRIRQLLPASFKVVTYDVFTDKREENLVKDAFTSYLNEIGNMPARIQLMCSQIIELVRDRPLLCKYFEYVKKTFDLSINGFVDEHNTSFPEGTINAPAIRRELDTVRSRSDIDLSISEIRDQIDCIKDISYWLASKDPGFPVSRLNRLRDDYYTVRETKYYAMVGARHPVVLMNAFYGALADRILDEIKNFKEDNKALLEASDERVRSQMTDPREETARQLHEEFLQYLNESRTNRAKRLYNSIVFHLHNGGTTTEEFEVQEFDEWLYYMQKKSERDFKEGEDATRSRRLTFANIGTGRFHDYIEQRERSVLQRSRTEAPTSVSGAPKAESTKRIKKKSEGQDSILAAWERYDQRVGGMSRQVNELADLIRALAARFDVFVRQHGFVHSQPAEISRADIQAARSRKDALGFIGVFAPEDKEEITKIGNRKHNRLFCGKRFSHGLDLPLESVIFTQSVEENDDSKSDAFGAIEILQMSGRCGRPSKSAVSVVYMSGSTYEKCMNGKEDAITNLLLRYKYYRQPADTNVLSSSAPALGDRSYNLTEVASLTRRMATTRPQKGMSLF